MKFLLNFFALLIINWSFAQDNLLTTPWLEGTGSIGQFIAMSNPNESVRGQGQGPFGPEILWNCTPSGTDNYVDGGWEAEINSINTNEIYRFSVWVKRTGGTNGDTRFSLKAQNASGAETSIRLDGSTNGARDFYKGDLPDDSWYLIVGFVYPIAYNGTLEEGGVFREQTGEKVLNANNFKYTAETVKMVQRAFFIELSAPKNQLQIFFSPRVEILTGETSSIEEMLGIDPDAGGGLWSTNNNGVHYNSGFVGIGNDNPDAPLAVSGRIHAQEVKVLATVPAPDYVFYKDYDLKTLEEIQEYIKEHGHLPNIPSAAEIEAKGIELGLMNMKLLEKIEELTLYILQQQKEIDRLNQLEKRIKELETSNQQ